MVAGKAKFCDRLWFKDHMLVYFGVLHLAQWVGSTAVLKITTFHTELVVMQSARNDIPRSKSKMKIALALLLRCPADPTKSASICHPGYEDVAMSWERILTRGGRGETL